MPEKQIEVIAGLFSGLMHTIVIALDHVGEQRPEFRKNMADHLRASADLVPHETLYRDAVIKTIKEAANGFDAVETGRRETMDISQLFH